MLLLQAGLVAATVVCLFVTGGALDRGFPIEVALLRGLLAFMAIALLAYVSELVVSTAEVRAPAAPAAPAAAPRAPLSLAAPWQGTDDAEAIDPPRAA